MSGVVQNLSDIGHFVYVRLNNILINSYLSAWHDPSCEKYTYLIKLLRNSFRFMKTLFTLFLLAVGFGAVAQRSSSKHVTTDGQQLRIRVDIEQPGRSVHYSRSFDVEDMEASAVRALENRIVDSLEQVTTGEYKKLSVSKKHADWSKKKQRVEEAVIRAEEADEDESEDETTSVSEALEASHSQSLSLSNVAPSSVLFREDKENGRLWMQYIFQKDGEELIIERTANVIGKTEREKQAIIKETERSFGIKTANQ